MLFTIATYYHLIKHINNNIDKKYYANTKIATKICYILQLLTYLLEVSFGCK